MAIVVMDLEVETPVSDWDTARAGGNGISVMVTLDYESGLYSFWGGRTLAAGAVQLEQADLLVTFNGKSFDLPCLEGVLEQKVPIKSHYDIFDEMKSVLPRERMKNTGLGPTCERTLGMGKLQNGESAPILYQNKHYPELYSYAWHDVFLTSTLFSHIVDFGFVIGPDGDKLCLRQPEELIGRSDTQ